MEESTCKFCKANTLFNKVTDRMYNSDGVTFHVDSCPTAKEHYKKEALERDARKGVGDYRKTWILLQDYLSARGGLLRKIVTSADCMMRNI